MLCTMGSRDGEPARSQISRCSPIARSAAYLSASTFAATFECPGTDMTGGFGAPSSRLSMSSMGPLRAYSGRRNCPEAVVGCQIPTANNFEKAGGTTLKTALASC